MNETSLHRYFIKMAYRGTRYHGWQIQPNAHTVQAEVNKAISTVLQEAVETTGAGRTDTGVHARFYIAHFDSAQKNLEKDEQFLFKLNNILPPDIAASGIYSVPHTAHARFDALSRTYKYVISTRKDPFLEEFAFHYYQKPDILQLNRACKILKGNRDFCSFSKLHSDVATYHCNIMEASWKEEGGKYIFTIKADRFLRNMVRAIVGTMMDIGLHKISLDDFRDIIEKKDRSAAGTSVPPQGLFLTRIDYPAHILPHG
ncbi:MAG: tRNA pseudouridine(38-40) synthase TruA [Chlorobi bacterium]|nr:tRNA pseudouridine(38-40) synthase TruA [Chlorobiota bacterium]